MTIDEFLKQLHGVKKTGAGWTARCPAHGDQENSLSVGIGEDGKILIKCFAGCPFKSIYASLNLTPADFFPLRNGGGDLILNKTVGAPGISLQQYADAKRLPIAFLKSLGLSEITLYGEPALRIPYYGVDGEEIAVRLRVAMSGATKFRWKSGSKPRLYGLQRLAEARTAGRIVLVEGESDTHTLWHNEFPAIGLPGAATWREEWAGHFDGIAAIFVVIEPDNGGEAVKRWLAKSRIRDRVRLVDLSSFNAKDPSELYLAAPETFSERFEAALKAAPAWTVQAAAEATENRARWWETCRELAEKPNILDIFVATIRESGVVGEERNAKLLYLSLTSRVFSRPVSAKVSGPSSGGKSFLIERVLAFFPNSAYYFVSATSERALVYSEESLVHRFLVIAEASG